MNNKTSYTPGPWKLEKTCLVTIQSTQARAILSGVTPLMSQFTAFCDGPDMEANARLVATAPELLTALQALLAKAQQIAGPFFADEVMDAEKAIAKATQPN